MAEAGAVGLEESHLPRVPDLEEGFAHDALHLRLVVLVGAEDVEELDPHDLAEEPVAHHPQVEELLGVAVHVDGPELRGHPVVVGEAQGAVAVSRAARGVEKGDLPLDGPAGQGAAVVEIVLHEVVGVALRRRGAGSHVDDGLGLEGKGAPAEHLVEGILVDEVGVAPLHEVLPLLRGPQRIDDQNVVDPLPVEFPDQRAADEPGPAGDDVHAVLLVRMPLRGGRRAHGSGLKTIHAVFQIAFAAFSEAAAICSMRPAGIFTGMAMKRVRERISSAFG